MEQSARYIYVENVVSNIYFHLCIRTNAFLNCISCPAVAPEVTVIPSVIHATKNEEVIMRCIVQALPSFNAYWTDKDGKKVYDNEWKYEVIFIYFSKYNKATEISSPRCWCISVIDMQFRLGGVRFQTRIG